MGTDMFSRRNQRNINVNGYLCSSGAMSLKLFHFQGSSTKCAQIKKIQLSLLSNEAN